jgi:hypothetical protein
MGLCTEQIEIHLDYLFGKPKAGGRKWLRNQRNRKIRRVPQTEVPYIKYKGWEY